ncbi:MAG: RNA 2',3'-cyclic phosphodiesterase, partial [Aestuariivirga sp.]
LSLRGIGVFGGNKPHAIIAHVEENGELRRLQQAQERICQEVGLEAEGRKFVPHVTLARLRDPDPLALRNFIESHALYRSRPFQVERFVLFSSRPLRGGGPYAVEEAYDLVGA